jgi:hypothetical protein
MRNLTASIDPSKVLRHFSSEPTVWAMFYGPENGETARTIQIRVAVPCRRR